MRLSFNGWCARVAAYGVSWGIHRAGTSNIPLIILKSRVSLAIFLRSSSLGHPRLVSISVMLSRSCDSLCHGLFSTKRTA